MTKKELIQSNIINILTEKGEQTLAFFKLELNEIASARTVGRAVNDLRDQGKIETIKSVTGKQVTIKLVAEVAPEPETMPEPEPTPEPQPEPEIAPEPAKTIDEVSDKVDEINKTTEGTLSLGIRMSIMDELKKAGMTNDEAKAGVQDIIECKTTLKELLDGFNKLAKDVPVEVSAEKPVAEEPVKTPRRTSKPMNRKQRKKAKVGKFAKKNPVCSIKKDKKIKVVGEVIKQPKKQPKKTPVAKPSKKAPKYAPYQGMNPRQYVKSLIEAGKWTKLEVRAKTIKIFPQIKPGYINTILSRACSEKHKPFEKVAVVDSKGIMSFA